MVSKTQKNPRLGCSVFLVAMLLISPLTDALEKETVEVKAVDEITVQQYTSSLEKNLENAIKNYLGEQEPFLIKVDAQLRRLLTYKNIIETRQQTVSEPITANNLQGLRPSKTDGTILSPQNNTQGRATISEQSGLSQESPQQIDDQLPLPGSPLYVKDQKTRRSLNTDQTLGTNSANSHLQQQIANLQQYINKQAGTIQNLQNLIQNPAQRVVAVVTTRRELIADNISVQKLIVKVWLADDLKQDKIAFVNDLIKEKADLNYVRGDELKVIPTQFPEKVKAQSDSVNEIVNPIKDLTLASFLNTLYDWFVPLLLLLLLTLFIMWLVRRRRRRASTVYSAHPIDHNNHNNRDNNHVIHADDPLMIGYQGEHSRKSTENGDKVRLDVVNEEITSLVILGDDLLHQTLVNSELPNSERLGIAAYLQKILGKNIFNKFAKNAVSEDEISGLSQSIDAMSLGDCYERAKQVHESLLNTKHQSSVVSKDKPFDFLNRMSDKRILYLLSRENTQTKALILSQLNSQRLAKIISQLPLNSQGQVAVEIGKLTDLPLETYQKLANYLARTANDIPEFQEINIDGDEVLIRTLEEMDLAGEATILNSLRERNPEQFYRIKKSYISFHDLPRIQIVGLKNLLRELERETIATALYDEEDRFRDYLLSTLPSRSQVLVNQLIKNMEPPGSSDILRCKKLISRKARQLLKADAIKLLPPTNHNVSTKTDAEGQTKTTNNSSPISHSVDTKNRLP